MYKSIKSIFAGAACAALLSAAVSAETLWKPPAEIAPKAAEAGAAAAPADAAPAAQAEPVSKADKEKSCNEQAAAKGLKGKAKKQFKAECLKS